MYILKVKVIDLVNEANDVAVILTCNLADSSGVVLTDTLGSIYNFTIRAPKSSLPMSGYYAYLTDLAVKAIAKKFDVTFLAEGMHDDSVLTASAANIARVFTELTVEGPGVNEPCELVSKLGADEILLSEDLTLTYTGNTTSPNIVFTGNVTAASSTISNIASTATLSEGMIVSGFGIPSGAVILSKLSATQVMMTQNALSSTVGATLTFTTNPESFYINTLSPALFTDLYKGSSITGAGIPDDTTIAEVISSSRVRLSQKATSTATGTSVTIVGPRSYSFLTAGLTLDLTDLQRVVDTINFASI